MKAGSGKNAIADIITEDESFCSIAFADILKRFLYKEVGFTKEQLWGSSEKRMQPHPFLTKNDGSPLLVRACLNSLGTGWGRDEVNQDIWAILTLNYIEKIQNDTKRFWGIYTPWDGWSYKLACAYNETLFRYKNFVLTDTRYNNELQAIKSRGGKILRIIRPGAKLEGEYAQHSSATEMYTFDEKDIDYTIINDGTLDDLRQKTANIIALLRDDDSSRDH